MNVIVIDDFYQNPDAVRELALNAEFKDGMLKLQIPKTKEAKPKAIEVKIS